MPTKKGSWRDKGKGDCFTRTNKSGASYVVCEGSKGQKGVYKKGAKPKPKTKAVKAKSKIIKKPKTAESKKKIEEILRKKKEKEKKKKEIKADKEENKEIRKEIKKVEKILKRGIKADKDTQEYIKWAERRKKRIAELKKKLK
jgi:spore germination cell wall hydrolase CwlJ-like protein